MDLHHDRADDHASHGYNRQPRLMRSLLMMLLRLGNKYASAAIPVPVAELLRDVRPGAFRTQARRAIYPSPVGICPCASGGVHPRAGLTITLCRAPSSAPFTTRTSPRARRGWVPYRKNTTRWCRAHRCPRPGGIGIAAYPSPAAPGRRRLSAAPLGLAPRSLVTLCHASSSWRIRVVSPEP